ncbi:MAG: phosphoenolpyruvate--protein phosphotransferase [Polyangiaceae bacterium]
MTDEPRKSSFPPRAPARGGPLVLQGIAGSPGVSVGKAHVLRDTRTAISQRRIATEEVDAEVARVRNAIEIAQKSIVSVSASVALPVEPAAILDAYQAMLSDPFLHERVEKWIRRELLCAEWAIITAGEEVASLFDKGHGQNEPASHGAYLRERKHDVEFVCDRLLRALGGGDEPASHALAGEPCIVIARDLSPADTAAMGKRSALAFVTERGSRTSHTSIMARALEVPAVVGVRAEALRELRTGDVVIVDGSRGVVVLYPTPSLIEEAEQRAERRASFARDLRGQGKDRPTRTSCETLIHLEANIEFPEEVPVAVKAGAEGIGLYRTEFLYIDRTTLPSEEEQYEVYRDVVAAFHPKPVTLRTFDIGGDKFASSFATPEEMNPALGLRAVRLALRRPEIFSTQLRAMLRARQHGDVRLMVPMITALDEITDVRRLIERAAKDVGVPVDVPVGMMVEVPAAAVMADLFAPAVDFFSIGTNDLVQYTLAIDRTSRELAHYASPFAPSILRLVRSVIQASSGHKVPVSLCGAMAQEALGALLLVGLGLRRLSMGAGALLEVKEALARVTLAECEAAAQKCLVQPSAGHVERLMYETFEPRLADLLRE